MSSFAKAQHDIIAGVREFREFREIKDFKEQLLIANY